MSDLSIQQGRVHHIRVAGTKHKNEIKKQDDVKTDLATQTPSTTSIPGDDMLTLMSQYAQAPGKTGKAHSKRIEVSKYVNNEQAARIGNSMNAFFAGMESSVKQAMKEFNLTENQAQDLVTMGFNKQFDDEDLSGAAIVASGEHLILT